METQTPQKEYSEKDIIRAFLSIDANIMINLYTNENVIFGRINPNDKVPIEQYLEKIGFRHIDEFINDLFLDGHHIKDGYVIEKNFNDRCFELYRDRIDFLFDKIPKDKEYEENDDDIFHYKYGLYDYLKNLYPIFAEIMKTEINPDPFAASPDILNETEMRTYYAAVSKFVLAIKTKGLRQGGRIDRYIKKMNFISPIVRRLIITRKGHYYLKNSNINSLDYKLALLSCFQFMNPNNSKLFELKLLRWEELKNTVS